MEVKNSENKIEQSEAESHSKKTCFLAEGDKEAKCAYCEVNSLSDRIYSKRYCYECFKLRANLKRHKYWPTTKEGELKELSEKTLLNRCYCTCCKTLLTKDDFDPKKYHCKKCVLNRIKPEIIKVNKQKLNLTNIKSVKKLLNSIDPNSRSTLLIHCAHCDSQKPADSFYPTNFSTCRQCLSDRANKKNFVERYATLIKPDEVNEIIELEKQFNLFLEKKKEIMNRDPSEVDKCWKKVSKLI